MSTKNSPRSTALAQERVQKASTKLAAAQEDLARLRGQLAAAEVDKALLQDNRQEREAIRQGVKATVETTPMPVRLEVRQVKMLKVLAALEGTTSSAIIRDCIDKHLDEKAASNPAFAAAAKSL